LFSSFNISLEIKEKNPHFGTSLLLANIGPNTAMSPKIVNGSFAALFDSNDVFQDFSKRLQDIGVEAKDSGLNSRDILDLPNLLTNLFTYFTTKGN
jgi:histidine decarboxylase